MANRNRLLRVRVAIDLDVADMPAARPGRLMRRDHAAPADLPRGVRACRGPPRRGSASGVSLRTMATKRSKHTTCPGRLSSSRTISMGRGEAGGSSRPSICSDAAVAMARPLPDCWVRQTPRS